jgi:hypothetical protein
VEHLPSSELEQICNSNWIVYLVLNWSTSLVLNWSISLILNWNIFLVLTCSISIVLNWSVCPVQNCSVHSSEKSFPFLVMERGLKKLKLDP